MTYLARLRWAVRRLQRSPYYATDTIEIWYDGPEARSACYLLSGHEATYTFLSTYASFAEVQRALQLPAPIEHITCVNAKKGIIEEFYHDGSSMLEREIAARGRAQ